MVDKSGTPVKLQWCKDSCLEDLQEEREICAKGFEHAYKSIPLEELKAPNLRAYALRVFQDVPDALKENPDKFYLL